MANTTGLKCVIRSFTCVLVIYVVSYIATVNAQMGIDSPPSLKQERPAQPQRKRANVNAEAVGVVLQFRAESEATSLAVETRDRLLSELVGVDLTFTFKIDAYYSFDFDAVISGKTLDKIGNTLSQHPDIISVDFNFVGDATIPAMSREIEPSRYSLYSDEIDKKVREDVGLKQWYLSSPYQSAYAGINAERAWPYSIGEGVVVAVIDSGLTTHPGLVSNVLPGIDLVSARQFMNDGDGPDADASDPGSASHSGVCDNGVTTSDWHGTAVASLVAGAYETSTGEFFGAAPGASILPVRGLGKCGRGAILDWTLGIYWAIGRDIRAFGNSLAALPVNAHPAKVINLSTAAFTGRSSTCPTFMQAAINEGLKQGVSFVVSAGNGPINTAQIAPANCDGVIVVGAANHNGSIAAYSNFGQQVDVLAPGGLILDFNGDGAIDNEDATSGGIRVLYNEGRHGSLGPTTAFLAGTSLATPMVSGVVALMHAISPNASPAHIESTLKRSVSPFSKDCPLASFTQSITLCGDGIVDAEHSLIRIRNRLGPVQSF